ncbi:hypothetical protein Gotri_002309, partial [Gossypium trilobum]|nr:hypothetical protein [Gossypium trilobum]
MAALLLPLDAAVGDDDDQLH